MNALLPALLLTLAAEGEGPAPRQGDAAAEEKQPAPTDAASLDRRIQELKERREKLVEQRDAARVRANTYVLPKDKLEAQKKQEEIDAVDAQLAELEAQKK